VDAFHALRGPGAGQAGAAFRFAASPAELRSRGLDDVVSFLVLHFADGRIINPDIRDTLLQVRWPPAPPAQAKPVVLPFPGASSSWLSKASSIAPCLLCPRSCVSRTMHLRMDVRKRCARALAWIAALSCHTPGKNQRPGRATCHRSVYLNRPGRARCHRSVYLNRQPRFLGCCSDDGEGTLDLSDCRVRHARRSRYPCFCSRRSTCASSRPT
jgi:hypothetical protein